MRVPDIAVSVAVLVVHLADVALCRNYELVFESIEGYEKNPEYLGPQSLMRIRRADKSSPPGLYHTVQYIKSPPNNTMVHATMFEMRDNKLVPSWLKFKTNFCHYLATERRPIFSEFGRIYKYTQCPLLGVFKLENYRPDDRILPPVMPGTDRMMLTIQFSTDTTNILKYGVMFVINRSKGSRKP